VRWRRLSTRDARPSPLISVAAWTAARRAAVRWTAAQLGSSALAPPLDSRRPSVASRLRRRRLSSPSPPGQRRGERLCAGATPRLEASVRRRSSRRLLDSGAAGDTASSCALDGGAARQQCAGAASQLETPVRRPSFPSPPGQRRGERLCAGQRRGEAAACWRHLSTRGLRPSPLVSVAVVSRLRRCLDSGAASSCALDGGAASQLRAPPLDSRRPSVASRLCRRLDSGAASSCALDGAGAAFDSRAPSVASRLIAVWTAVGEAAVRWPHLSTRDACPSPLVSVAASSAARRGSCALAPPLNPERPSVASRLCRRLASGAARQQCAGATSRLEASVLRLSSHRRLDSGAARQLCAGQRRGKAAVR